MLFWLLDCWSRNGPLKSDSESDRVRCRNGDEGVEGERFAVLTATDAALTSLAILLRLEVEELRLPPGPRKIETVQDLAS